MPGWFDLGNIWKNLREIDLRPIRQEAERQTWLALVGARDNSVQALAEALHAESRRALPATDASRNSPALITAQPNDANAAMDADLVVLVLDEDEGDDAPERALFQRWLEAGKQVIVFYNRVQIGHGTAALRWRGAQVVNGAVDHRERLENEFVPAALALLPERHLSLARYYPLFRIKVARQLIQDTSVSNASYAFTTGLAEIIPVLDVPFNVADMIVLTKAQAFMAYKLGLALGLSTRWQDHLAAFGGTVGSGFLWRQLARGLVGLIPVWGIIPKVAVAYAGTYALGYAILQWYITGAQITPETMRGFYQDALGRGKEFARTLRERAPRSKPRLGVQRPRRLPARASLKCPHCEHANPREFNYCGNCGSALSKV